MGKVVYNGCFGGFSLSNEAIALYGELKALNLVPVTNPRYPGYVTYYLNGIEDNDHHFDACELDRDDPILVEVVERLGDKASGDCSKLFIEEIPTGSLWRIDEYDGRESVMMQSDYNWKVAK